MCYNIYSKGVDNMKKYIPLEKMSKREQRAYYAQMRGSPIPPSRRGKTPREYKEYLQKKRMEREVKGYE